MLKQRTIANTKVNNFFQFFIVFLLYLLSSHALFHYLGISHSDISGITTKAPYEAVLMGEHHVRIEISDFVMRTFVLF